MAVTPNWQAATSGSAANAGHVNQFLGTHNSNIIYTGTQTAVQSTAGSGSTHSDTVYIAQSFATTASQTTIGHVTINVGSTTGSGSNLAPTTVGIYANSAGAPTGSALVSTTITAEYAFNGPAALVIPLPVTGLSISTTYWIVLGIAGNSTYYYGWSKSNQVSGTSTSTNGTTWSAQAYGSLYAVYDLTASGRLVATWEDSGNRWVWYSIDGTTQQLTQLAEYTAGQTSSGYLQSFKSLTYSGNAVTVVS
jgi:hypothetical protein